MDDDGHQDLVTGSFGGLAYVLHGSAEKDGRGLRRFAPPMVLADLTGDPLCIGMYRTQGAPADVVRTGAKSPEARMLSVVPVDWDGDGDLDLVAGEVDGRILLFVNDGTKKAPEFEPEPRAVRAGRKSLWVKSGHSMISVGDWNGDGLLDIVSGSSGGAVLLWPGAPRAADDASTEPQFSKPIELIADHGESEDLCDMPPSCVAERTQPHLADLDGDGVLELLVGDDRSCTNGDEKNSRTAHGFVWVFHRRTEFAENLQPAARDRLSNPR